ncbi:hypothetical protein BGX38DRAFT_442988 [Terfezia claveryi]|nr:hypothetical protein BGX38DRAFT_442988 [Terfezia claveryi]
MVGNVLGTLLYLHTCSWQSQAGCGMTFIAIYSSLSILKVSGQVTRAKVTTPGQRLPIVSVIYLGSFQMQNADLQV